MTQWRAKAELFQGLCVCNAHGASNKKGDVKRRGRCVGVWHAHETETRVPRKKSPRCKNRAKIQRLSFPLLPDLGKVYVVSLSCTTRLSAANLSYQRQADTLEQRGVNVESY